MREVIADVNIAFGIYCGCARTNERCLFRRAINVIFSAAACNGGHNISGDIQFANLRIVPIGNDEIAFAVTRDARSKKERSLKRRAVLFNSTAGNGRDNSIRRHPANAAVEKVCNHQIALRIECQLRCCA